MINNIPYTTPKEEKWLQTIKTKQKLQDSKKLKSAKIFKVEKNQSWFGKFVDGKLR
jgi:hypothetical protein